MRSPHCIGFISFLAVAAVQPTIAQVEAHWINPAGGSWTGAGNWSTDPDFPNNDAENTFHAIIDLAGPPYSVGLESDITISDFTLNSTNATVAHTAGVLRVLGNANLAAGTYRLDGGTLEGGVWNISGGSLALTTNDDNRLRGVTINGNVNLAVANSRLRLADGLTMTGALTLGGSGAQVTTENSQTIDGGTLRFDPITSGTKTLSISSGATVTLGPSQRVSGGRGAVSGTGALINTGLISADSAGQTIIIAPVSFTNQGVLETRNGGGLTLGAAGTTWANAAGGSITANAGTLSLAGNWSNQGAITVAGATVTLGGNFSTASLNGLFRIGGTVNLTGQLDNSGAQLALNTVTGSWNLDGGRITGGQLISSGGARLVPRQHTENVLDGVEVGDALDFSTGGWVRATTATTFTTPLVLGGNGARLGLDVGRTLDNQTITLSGAGNAARQLSAEGNGDLVLGPNTIVQGSNARITSGLFAPSPNARIINQGRITNQSSGFEIGPAHFRNEGIVEVLNSGRLTLGWNGTQHTHWSNVGTIRIGSSSTLELRGTFSTADIGTIDRTGGTVRLGGTLDNTGATLTFNDGTGSWEMGDATIRGGTVNTSATNGIVFRGGDNYLDGVMYNGNITLGTQFSSASVHLSPTTVLNGTIGGGIGSVWLDSGGTYDLDINLTGEGTLRLMGDGTTVLGPGFSMQTRRGGIESSSNATLINRGSLLATGGFSGDTFQIEPDLFQNEGSVRATVGTTVAIGQRYDFETPRGDVVNAYGGLLEADGGTLLLGGRWTNEGIVRVRNNGTLNLSGEFATSDIGIIERTGGTVRLSGTVDNHSDTLRLDANTGIWAVKYGKIMGGTLDLTAGPYIRFDPTGNNNPRNEMHGVTIAGNFNLTGSTGGVTIYDGLNAPDGVTLSGDSFLAFGESTVVGATFAVDGYRDAGNSEHFSWTPIEGNSSVTLAADGVIRGRGHVIGKQFAQGGTNQFINEGLIHATTAGLPIFVSARQNVNRGLMHAENGGTLYFAEADQGPIQWRNEATGVIRGTGGLIGASENAQDSRVVGTNLGLIEAIGGTLRLGGVWTNQGTIIARDGALTTLGSYSAMQGSWSNQGVIEVSHATMEWDKSEDSLGVNTGEIRLTHTSGRIDAPWRNDGLMRISDGTDLRVVPGRLVNLSVTTLNGGDWYVGAGSTLNLDSAAITVNNADIVLDGPGSTFVALDRLERNQGELSLRSGRDFTTIGTLLNEGSLSAGRGSLLTVHGAFEQSPSSRLAFDLAGTGLGLHGALDVDGMADLAGTLDVRLTDGFMPTFGMTFGVISAAGIQGEFTGLLLPPLSGGLSFAVGYDATTVWLDVVPEPSTLVLLACAACVLRRHRSAA